VLLQPGIGAIPCKEFHITFLNSTHEDVTLYPVVKSKIATDDLPKLRTDIAIENPII